MSDNKRNIPEDPNARKGEGVSGLGKGKQTGPQAGGADNTRGQNKPSHMGSSGGAKQGKPRAAHWRDGGTDQKSECQYRCTQHFQQRQKVKQDPCRCQGRPHHQGGDRSRRRQ